MIKVSILDGFEDICSPSQQIRNDGMFLKIHRRSFTFAMATCRALKSERVRVKYNMAKHIIALVPCNDPRDGVKVNQNCATIVSSKTLGTIVEDFFTAKKMVCGRYDSWKLHGEFKEVTENGKPIRAVFFNLVDAKAE